MAPYTTDADLVIDPDRLADQPLVGAALGSAGFLAGVNPGEWLKGDVRVDLMVPEAVASKGGTRGARLGPHGNKAARKARGLEGALVDREPREITSMGGGSRSYRVLVAGPGALLVSKLHKIAERIGDAGRERDKDALDVLRILQGVSLHDLARRARCLQDDPRSSAVTEEALGHLNTLFGKPSGAGCLAAVRASEKMEEPEIVIGSCVALTGDLLDEIGWKPPEDR